MLKKILSNSKVFGESFLEVFLLNFLGLWASLLVLTTLLFVLKIPVGIFHFTAAALTAFSFSAWYSKTSFKKGAPQIFFYSSFFFIILFLVSVLFVSKIYDLSYDGQAYHQEAVIQLSRGWNPVYMILENEATANLERWLNHYPKGVWILASSLYKMTGNIESGKVLSLFTIPVSFLAVFWALWRINLSKFLKFLLAFSISLNPVSLYQSLSYYADGVLVNMLLILACICFKFIQTKNKKLLFPFAFSFIALSNIKLSAPVFGMILIGSFLLYLWLSEKLKMSLELFKISAVSIILGILFVGFNPYVTNFSLKGNPLYPAVGKGAYDYVPLNTPQNFWNLASPLRLFVSIFSISSHKRGEGQFSQLKLPFTFSEEELRAFRETNTKTAGFGPLFGGIVALCFALLIFYVVSFDEPRKKKLILVGSAFIVFSSAAIVSTSSVARYVPFFWWLPFFIIIFYLLRKNKVNILVGVWLLVALLANTFLVAASYFPYNISQSRKLESQLTQLQKGSISFAVDVGVFGSTKLKLKNHHISYREVFTNASCKSRKRFLISSVAEMCEE